MLDGISGFFVREKTALDGDDQTSSVLDYGSGSSQYWKLLTSALLNKFNPRNKIFEQELSKKRVEDEKQELMEALKENRTKDFQIDE